MVVSGRRLRRGNRCKVASVKGATFAIPTFLRTRLENLHDGGIVCTTRRCREKGGNKKVSHGLFPSNRTFTFSYVVPLAAMMAPSIGKVLQCTVERIETSESRRKDIEQSADAAGS